MNHNSNQVRGLGSRQMKQKLTEMGIDYKAKGATTQDQLRSLLVRAISEEQNQRSRKKTVPDPSKRKRRPKEISNEPERGIKQPQVKKRQTERMASINRPTGVKIPQINKPKKKAPPGILGRMPPQRSLGSSADRGSQNSSASSSSVVSGQIPERQITNISKEDTSEDPRQENPLLNNYPNKAHTRKKWDLPSGVNQNLQDRQSQPSSRERGFEAQEAHNQNLQDNSLIKRQKEMEERRRKRSQANRQKSLEQENQKSKQTAQDLFRRTLASHINQTNNNQNNVFQRKPQQSVEPTPTIQEESSFISNPRESSELPLVPDSYQESEDQTPYQENSSQNIQSPDERSYSSNKTSEVQSNYKIPAHQISPERPSEIINEPNIRNRFPVRISRIQTNNERNDPIPFRRDQKQEPRRDASRFIPSRTNISPKVNDIIQPQRPIKEDSPKYREIFKSTEERRIPRAQPSRHSQDPADSSVCSKIVETITQALILIIVIFVLAGCVKLAELGYYKFLAIDTTTFCPSGQTKDSRSNCHPCPENGSCDINGKLTCKLGFIRSGKTCITDDKFNNLILQFSSKYHEEYLYYLGDLECGNTNTTLTSQEFISTKMNSQMVEIKDSFDQKNTNEISKITQEISKIFSESLEITKDPRYSLQCGLKKLIRDNLVLIVIGGISFTFIVYLLFGCIMTVMNKLEARKIYKEIEKDLRSKSSILSDSFDTGISIPEIVSKFRRNRSESSFQTSILPYLERHRKANKKVVVFNKTENAKQVNVWQYKK
ncbi:unnamed protein product [Moneuplotes crassus]|uniref:Man1/Src1 C-terminal domain-containing protein n=1 Tax=Euplotes crassus TaxID=5936 RepID=A0AAD2D739_EUPCR|nr:unnamed protein product [Moneuplotes crassus]